MNILIYTVKSTLNIIWYIPTLPLNCVYQIQLVVLVSTQGYKWKIYNDYHVFEHVLKVNDKSVLTLNDAYEY